MIKFLFLLLIPAIPLVSYAQNDSTKAVKLESVYSALPWYNAYGGLDQDMVYMGNLDLTGEFQIGQLIGNPIDLTLFAYVLGNHGGKATDLMGDFQVASNIQAPTSWRVFEWWLQQNLFNERLSVLFGLYDLNSEFDVLKPGTLFINSSFGIGAEYAQSGPNGPSIFPVSSLGFRFATSPHDRLKLKLAILDGVPGDPTRPKSNRVSLSAEEGVLLAFEASVFTATEFTFEADALERQAVTRRNKVGREHQILTNDKINLGGWYYTGRFHPIGDSTVTESGNWGAYIGVQKYLFKAGSTTRYLSLFGRFGIASNTFNRFGSAVSGGMVFSSIFRGMKDYLGVAFSSGFNGTSFLEVNPRLERPETVLEGTYSLALTNWLTVQPDVQYVIHPSSRVDLRNPLAFAVLIQFSM